MPALQIRSEGAAAVYLTNMAALCFILSTTAANSKGQQALSATVRGLCCHVGVEGGERGSQMYGGGTAVNLQIEGEELKRFFSLACCSLY